MDSLLLLGNHDQKLTRFLSKMGYSLVQPDGTTSVPDVFGQQVIDLVLLDAESELDPAGLLEFLRSSDGTKKVPLVCLGTNKTLSALCESSDSQLEVITHPYSLGSVVSKIATHLRLRKMAGVEESASLAEINAALRDLNERFGQQLEEARQIQQSLLTNVLPQEGCFDLAVVYKPLEEVGGDWYHVAQDDSHVLTALVADVTGHGLAAAFIGSMTKLALTAAGQQEPGNLLGAMNRLMTPQIPSGRFVTMCACRYEPETGRLAFARAGHPPAMLIRQDGQVEQLQTDGFAIGFFDDGEYEQHETLLEPGDMVALFTDGILEAQNRDQQMYGTERLAEALRTAAAGSAEDVLGAVLRDFDEFRDGRILKDDLTIVVMKRRR